MDLSFANISNSSSDHSDKTKTSYTRDGWSFEENKIYEIAMTKFEDTSSMAFFEHVAFLMPWQTIDSIINHEKIMIEDMNVIKESNGNFEDIVEEVMEMEEETTRRTRKRGIPWTPEEHK